MNFKAYGRMTNTRTMEQFRLDMFKELNVEDTPEMNGAFARAWSYGYEGGHEEVFEHFRDLVAIFRETQGSF